MPAHLGSAMCRGRRTPELLVFFKTAPCSRSVSIWKGEISSATRSHFLNTWDITPRPSKRDQSFHRWPSRRRSRRRALDHAVQVVRPKRRGTGRPRWAGLDSSHAFRQGDRVVFSRPTHRPATGMWDVDIGRGTTARLTNHVANDWHAVWSPDGRQLVFGSDRDGGPEVMPYLKTSMDPGSSEHRISSASSRGSEVQARRQGFSLVPYDWAANGWMAYEGAGDVFVGPASAAREPFAPHNGDDLEGFRGSRLTANGLPTPQESGRAEVTFAVLRSTCRAFRKAPGSNNGSEYAVWGPSGREIFTCPAMARPRRQHTRPGTNRNPPHAVLLFRTCASSETLLGPASTHAMASGSRRCRMEPPGRSRF